MSYCRRGFLGLVGTFGVAGCLDPFTNPPGHRLEGHPVYADTTFDVPFPSTVGTVDSLEDAEFALFSVVDGESTGSPAVVGRAIDRGIPLTYAGIEAQKLLDEHIEAATGRPQVGMPGRRPSFDVSVRLPAGGVHTHGTVDIPERKGRYTLENIDETIEEPSYTVFGDA